jgi:hypothetical protein
LHAELCEAWRQCCQDGGHSREPARRHGNRGTSPTE